MVDATEKIWAVFGNHGLLAFRDDRPHSVEYTRSDLVAELSAENERLRTLVMAQSRAIHSPEALSRTGAVKVKALTWSDHPAGGEQALGAGLGLYRVHANGDDWYLVPDHMGTGGKAAAQADYERRILSALEPAAPEGQQPVAYRVHAPADEHYGIGPDRLQFHPLAQYDLDNGYRQTPLYPRPSEQAVTEAARRVLEWVYPIAGDNRDEAAAKEEIDSVEALKAAMEAGR